METKCKDCAFFSRHYSLRHSRIIETGCGTCLKKRQKLNNNISSDACRHFTQAEKCTDIIKANAIAELTKAIKRVNDILLILDVTE